MKITVRKIAAEGVLLAGASIVFLIESLLPPLLVIAPYVKLGLANIFVLFVLVRFGAKDAFIFVLAKNLLTALVVPFAFLFNLAGSLCAYAVMAGMYAAFKRSVSLVAVSVAGAVLNNIARTGVAAILMEALSLYVQLPFVSGFGIAAGIIIGISVIFCLKYLPERLTSGR